MTNGASAIAAAVDTLKSAIEAKSQAEIALSNVVKENALSLLNLTAGQRVVLAEGGFAEVIEAVLTSEFYVAPVVRPLRPTGGRFKKNKVAMIWRREGSDVSEHATPILSLVNS